jgi:hypothetical protein
MAEFIVRDPRLTHVHVEVPARKGTALASFPVRGTGFFRRVSVPDKHLESIKPAHAKGLVRVNVAAPVPTGFAATFPPAAPAAPVAPGAPVAPVAPELSTVESLTVPATPRAKSRRGGGSESE